MAKQNILIVEDEASLRDAYTTILKKEGYKIENASDGLKAQEVLKDFEPDLILLDLRMPNMSGIEFLKKYNPVAKHPKVKIIVFSNLDTENEIDEAYNYGAHKYMLKAWASPKELSRFVRETLAQGDSE